jgi:hypothetical protein
MNVYGRLTIIPSSGFDESNQCCLVVDLVIVLTVANQQLGFGCARRMLSTRESRRVCTGYGQLFQTSARSFGSR